MVLEKPIKINSHRLVARRAIGQRVNDTRDGVLISPADP
jgi:hypothetical protein